jgi:methylmalonyl-CoA mutase N-terminal domain/subunit
MQVKKLAGIRQQRDSHQVATALSRLREAANDEKVNLMPVTIEAVKTYATIGEICGVLREIFGEYSGYNAI